MVLDDRGFKKIMYCNSFSVEIPAQINHDLIKGLIPYVYEKIRMDNQWRFVYEDKKACIYVPNVEGLHQFLFQIILIINDMGGITMRELMRLGFVHTQHKLSDSLLNYFNLK